MCKNLSCSTRPRRRRYLDSASTVSTLLIVLLPKCPLCILSYSSAIALCGTAETLDSGWETGSWLTIAWAVLTLGTLLYNYKGKRTLHALGLSVWGMACIIGPYLFAIDIPYLFYLGVGLLLSGIWVNGSFTYFFRELILPVWKRLLYRTTTFARIFTS